MSALSAAFPAANASLYGSGDTRCDTPGLPHCDALYAVNSAPDFFHSAGPNVDGVRQQIEYKLATAADSQAVVLGKLLYGGKANVGINQFTEDIGDFFLGITSDSG